MRHNQSGRRFRGRNNANGQAGGGGHHSHHHNHSNSGRRINPRVQTFDSNGPDVRIRGNAVQINEKYQALARDAAAAGDRILAESYHQHAEHYQRMINEMNEEFARQNPQQYHQQQQALSGEEPQPSLESGSGEHTDAMPDLDQGFLVGTRPNGNGHAHTQAQGNPATDLGDAPQPEAGEPVQSRGRHYRHKESETA